MSVDELMNDLLLLCGKAMALAWPKRTKGPMLC